MEATPSRPDTASGPDKFDSVCAILERYSYQPAKLIPILQAVQNEYRYLPEGVMMYVATALKIPPARVFGVATFYAHFALKPKGKYVVRLCDGTACHVKESVPILEALRRHLGLDEKTSTTPDMLFTVETVACVGACGLAPVVVVNDDVHGQMTPKRAIELIDAIREQERTAT
jgi:NADH-quinone oxidoreductase subunit E